MREIFDKSVVANGVRIVTSTTLSAKHGFVGLSQDVGTLGFLMVSSSAQSGATKCGVNFGNDGTVQITDTVPGTVAEYSSGVAILNGAVCGFDVAGLLLTEGGDTITAEDTSPLLQEAHVTRVGGVLLTDTGQVVYQA